MRVIVDRIEVSRYIKICWISHGTGEYYKLINIY